jgi:hypothetical protein
MREMRNAYRIFVGKPEGKRPFGRHRATWDANTGLNLREIGLKNLHSPTLRNCEQKNITFSNIKSLIDIL